MQLWTNFQGQIVITYIHMKWLKVQENHHPTTTIGSTTYKSNHTHMTDNTLLQWAWICADKYVAWIGTKPIWVIQRWFFPYFYLVVPALAADLFTTQSSFSRNICITQHTLDDNAINIYKFCHSKTLPSPPCHRHNNKQYLFEPCILLLLYSN